MSILASLLVVGFLTTSLVAQEAKETVKFAKKTLKKGDVFTLARNTSEEVAQSLALPDMTQNMAQKSQSKDVKIFTVIAVGEKGVTEAKLEYKTFESKNTVNQGGQDKVTEDESPLVGKTYLLSIKDGVLAAKNAEGEAASATELTALNKELKNELAIGCLLDPCQRMDSIIGQREVAVGEAIKVDKATANQIFGASDSGQSIKSITLTLKGKKTVLGVECGVFDVKLEVDTARMEAMGLTVRTDIVGELTVGTSNLWAYTVKVAGPVEGSGIRPTPQGDATVEIKGKVSMSAMAAITVKK